MGDDPLHHVSFASHEWEMPHLYQVSLAFHYNSLIQTDKLCASYYHAGLSNKIISRTRFWVAGHQHDTVEKVIADGSTTFICNPKGTVPLKPRGLKIIVFYL
ncbi:hypothetical protein HORM4_160039 [Vibrio harveyi]|nr:hypothetical protein HORM4_160039 [Vibrio harveyi]